MRKKRGGRKEENRQRKMLGNKLDTLWRRKRISNMKRGQGLSDSRKIKEVHWRQGLKFFDHQGPK